MKSQQLSSLLEAFYSDGIESEDAWKTYNNFYQICSEGDQDTIDYLHKVIDMKREARLLLRNRISEKGFELTPNQLDQYIFLLFLAIYDYIDDGHDEYT